MSLLKINDLKVRYGNIRALKGISLEVNEGEIVTLIGSNGAGKSTTMNTISGIVRANEGTVEFQGENITKLGSDQVVKRGIILSPEGRQVFPFMSVAENLAMGAITCDDKELTKKNFEFVYDLFPILKERQKQAAGTLSGGEQQMLAMSRALMSHPKLMMLDEPSMGLAPILVDQIFEIIKELHRNGTTILLVEQNARKALQIADRAYVLETGNITLTGTGAELASSDAVKKAYLGG